MSEEKIICPNCTTRLDVPEDLLGHVVECPVCNVSLQMPAPEPKATSCPFCGEDILSIAIKCKHCGEFLDGSRPKQNQSTPQSKPSPPAQSGKPACQQCGAAMHKTVVSSGNCAGVVVALIVLAAGIFIVVAIPVIGWIIGPIICIGALFMGGKRQKVWKCTKCGSVVNRA